MDDITPPTDLRDLLVDRNLLAVEAYDIETDRFILKLHTKTGSARHLSASGRTKAEAEDAVFRAALAQEFGVVHG